MKRRNGFWVVVFFLCIVAVVVQASSRVEARYTLEGYSPGDHLDGISDGIKSVRRGEATLVLSDGYVLSVDGGPLALNGEIILPSSPTIWDCWRVLGEPKEYQGRPDAMDMSRCRWKLREGQWLVFHLDEAGRSKIRLQALQHFDDYCEPYPLSSPASVCGR